MGRWAGLRNGRMGGRADFEGVKVKTKGFIKPLALGWMDGLRDGRRNGWAGGGMGLRVGFINILVM